MDRKLIRPAPESINSLPISITFTLSEWADVSGYLRWAHTTLGPMSLDKDIKAERGRIVELANRILAQVIKAGMDREEREEKG